MKSKGWTKRYRARWASPAFQRADGSFDRDRYLIFDYIIDLAQWEEDVEYRIAGSPTIYRGSCYVPYKELVSQFGYSKSTISEKLGELAERKMIAKRTEGERTQVVITVCNYNDYQGPKNQPRTEAERNLNGSRTEAERKPNGSRTPFTIIEEERTQEERSAPVDNSESSENPPPAREKPEDPLKRTKPTSKPRPGKATKTINARCPDCGRDLWISGDEKTWFCWKKDDDPNLDGCGFRGPVSDGKSGGWFNKGGRLVKIGVSRKIACIECGEPVREIPDSHKWRCFSCNTDYRKSEGWRVRDGVLYDEREENRQRQAQKTLEHIEAMKSAARRENTASLPAAPSGPLRRIEPTAQLNAVSMQYSQRRETE